MLVTNGACGAVHKGVQDGHFDPHLTGRLAQHLPQLAAPQHPDDPIGHAMHRRVALPETPHEREQTNQVKTLQQRPRDAGIARNSPSGGNQRRQSARIDTPRIAYPSVEAGSMDAPARNSERGGGEAELRLGSRAFQEGRQPAEGMEEEEVEAAAARDGALSSLACMLPETVARVQPGV